MAKNIFDTNLSDNFFKDPPPLDFQKTPLGTK